MRRIWFTLLVLTLAGCAAPQRPDQPPPATPTIQHWTLPNGVRAYFVPAPEIPMVDVQVLFDAGSARDGAAEGLAQMTARMLTLGAGGQAADAILDRFESVGASFGVAAGPDAAAANLRVLTEPAALDVALDTAALVLRSPDFPAADLARERERMKVALRERDQSPGGRVGVAFLAALYGDHPYARSGDGTAATLDALDVDALRRFHATYYTGRNAVVAIVGAVDRAQAESIVARLLGGLPAGTTAAPIPVAPEAAQPQAQKLPHPSQQVHLRLGQPVMLRNDPDYFPLYVGNHILGGSGLVSRLSNEIREKRGMAYSVYSYFAPLRGRGPLQLGMQTKVEQAAEAERLLRAELERFIAEGPTAAELQAAQRNITGGFPLRLDSNRDIVEQVAHIGYYGLPADWLQTFTARVEAVTVDAIRDAYRRRVRPDRLTVVIVGG